ncbi:MAG: HAD-IIA family hydrolase [Clostridiales bacterium]|nr:HAD-IIA family hydrolase [Clostridiales bacterium]
MRKKLSTALRQKKLYLLDMDGTLYLGDRLFEDTLPFLHALKDHGARPVYLTNNSSRSTEAYVDKLARLGIRASAEDFFTSTDAACAWLKHRYGGNGIYALGTASFRTQLAAEGLPVRDSLTDDVDCLLLGYDTELTYQKLVDACKLLKRGVLYLATNPDLVCPTEFGYVPDCGSLTQALEHATGRMPTVIGKPQPQMALLAMDKYGCTKEETILVGDRLYTDIACGVSAGIDTVLVFSGEARPEDLLKSKVKPAFTAAGVGELLEALDPAHRP